MLWQLILGFYLSAAIASVAWWRNALDAGGSIAAVAMGTVIFGLGGLGPSVALILFFMTGSILSALPHRRQSMLQNEVRSRTWKQVAANGTVPMLAILASKGFPSHATQCLLAYYGSLATSCSDTYGTEIGIRFGGAVRESSTGQIQAAGLSGGVSLGGILGSIAGAILVAACVWIPNPLGISTTDAFIVIVCAGILGSLADSILGSTMQGKFQSASGELFERHPVTENFIIVGGFPFVSNNAVNALTSLGGAIFALLIF